MIAFLEGQIAGTRGRAIILQTAGIGYLVHVPNNVWASAKPGNKLALHIHTHQTADTISLFGFTEEDELQFFEQLISVNGVGPKSALDILESPVDTVRGLILAGDAKALAKTKGIGPKTAARIVLELKNKMDGSAVEVPDMSDTATDEAIVALESLGYKNSQIKKMLTKLPASKQTTEDIVSWFLQAV